MSVRPSPVSCAALTRTWIEGVGSTAVVPMSDEETGTFLDDLLRRLVEALAEPASHQQLAADVGARLVGGGFVGEQSLGRAVGILSEALPALQGPPTAEAPAGRVGSLLGALATGYTAALRRRVLDQHEDVKRSLLRARNKAERARRVSETRLREVFDAAPLGVAVSRLDEVITDTNGALVEMLAYPPGKLTGRAVRELFHPDDTGRLTAAYRKLTAGQDTRLRTRVRLLAANGDTIWASLAVSMLRDPDGHPTHHVTMIEDVNDVHLLEQRLRHQTLHDLRTGRPNQEYFWIHLKAVLERAGPETTITLCKIDLDGFGMINIGHGHDAGNLVLCSVAGRLQALVSGEHAMVARFGADEFALLIENTPATPDTASLAAAINAELTEPVYFGDTGLAVSACVGITRCPARGLAAAEVVRTADAALHRAKRTGRGQWALADPSADAAEQARYALATAMPGAWESGQVTVHYQPLVRLDPASVDAGRIIAVQALLHWRHPEQGVVTHEDCVAFAEQTGLVCSIGPWLLNQACRQLRAWRDQSWWERSGTVAPVLRVDLITQLAQDPDLMGVLRATLEAAGLRPRDLQLGIPVELIVAGHSEAQENLRALADAGVWTVLTGYGQAVGNLTTLENHPVHAVDITGQLVRLAADRSDSMVRQALSTLVPLIRRTGIGVVVADVDSPDQADWWRSIGADSARGAAFTAPRPPEDIPRLLAAG